MLLSSLIVELESSVAHLDFLKCNAYEIDFIQAVVYSDWKLPIWSAVTVFISAMLASVCRKNYWYTVWLYHPHWTLSSPILSYRALWNTSKNYNLLKVHYLLLTEIPCGWSVAMHTNLSLQTKKSEKVSFWYSWYYFTLVGHYKPLVNYINSFITGFFEKIICRRRFAHCMNTDRATLVTLLLIKYKKECHMVDQPHGVKPHSLFSWQLHCPQGVELSRYIPAMKRHLVSTGPGEFKVTNELKIIIF